MQFRCPQCKHQGPAVADIEGGSWTCSNCRNVFEQRDGVWRALSPDRWERFEQFSEEYLSAGHAEGWGSESPDYYWALPFGDAAGKRREQWRVRARTYRFFERKILEPLEEAAGRPLNVLDLGGGVGWLSYRLALRGHNPVTVDLLDDRLNGLGSARHYLAKLEQPLTAVQADFDDLPIADEQADLAVFNDSFHYAPDYRRTLREVRRVLGWGGQVAVLDTPIYPNWRIGEMARDQRRGFFQKKYGFPADSLLSMEYLDEKMIWDLAEDLNISWRVYRPWYGIGDFLLPALAKLQGRRPPPRFWMLQGNWVGA